MENNTLDNYDVWYKPCKKCGYDTGKSTKLKNPKCWRCGEGIQRDYSKRALKKENKGEHNA